MDLYTLCTHTCCIFVISSISHRREASQPSMWTVVQTHRTLSSWCNGRVSATHWSCASWRVKYLKFSADEPRHSPIVFVGKIPHDTRHANQWVLARHELYVYISYWRVQLQTAFFLYGKGLCKEKNSQWILGKPFTPFHTTWTQSKVPPCWWGRYLDTQQICRFNMPKTPKPQEMFWKFRDFSWNQNILKISVFFHARQGFSQLCAGKQTCPTRQCPSPRHVYTCKHVPPAARLFRMLPLVPFNGRQTFQTMINCICIQHQNPIK